MKNITRKTFLKTVQAATFLGVMSTCLPKTFATENFTDELVATSDTQYIRVTPDGMRKSLASPNSFLVQKLRPQDVKRLSKASCPLVHLKLQKAKN